LFTDIMDHPRQYLNGTAPLNVTGAVNACPFAAYGTQPLYCTVANGTDADSFIWSVILVFGTSIEYSPLFRYDELHPSDQVHRIVAREIATVLKGKYNKWATWLS
jgi:hypothetical protein